MAYDLKLADRIREYLAEVPALKIKEKEMFSGLAFLVNGKMCVNVSHENLMCRFNPERFDEVSERMGFLPMIMRGKQLNGYCYVSPDGFKKKKIFNSGCNCVWRIILGLKVQNLRRKLNESSFIFSIRANG